MWCQYFILLTSFIINHKVMGLVEQVVDRRAALFRLPLTTSAIPLLWRGQPAIAQSMERNNLDFILSRFDDMQAPFQLNALQYGVRGGLDTLLMPEWLLGKWTVRSRLAASSAPLGRKYLPPDLRNMLITRDNENSDQEMVAKAKDAVAQAPGLEYQVQFIRRSSNDGAVVADRAYNLKSVQDAAAGPEECLLLGPLERVDQFSRPLFLIFCICIIFLFCYGEWVGKSTCTSAPSSYLLLPSPPLQLLIGGGALEKSWQSSIRVSSSKNAWRGDFKYKPSQEGA